MKVIVVLTLVSIFAAIATAAPEPAVLKIAIRKAQKAVVFRSVMERGRRLQEKYGYMKLTCEKNVKAIIAGLDGNCNAASTATSAVAFPIDSCVHVAGETSSLKFTVNGTDITLAFWMESKVCEGTPLELTYENNVCSDTSIYKIYEGEVIEMDGHGTKDDCSDVKPFIGGMKIIPDRCLENEEDGDSGKITCSSDHDTITWQHYTDAKCGTKGEKEEHKSGVCFDGDVVSKATTGKSFLMLTLVLPTAALLCLQ
jgi:hypothetical protein